VTAVTLVTATDQQHKQH